MFNSKYTITNKILNNLNRISSVNTFILNASIIPKWEATLRREAIVRSTHSSTHIEGNQLNLEEVRDLLDGKEVEARPRDKQEVINYKKVLDYIDKIYNHKITEKTIKEINRITLENIQEGGEYRKIQNVISEKKGGIERVVYTPPSPKEVPLLMQEFVDWLNSLEVKEVSPILVSGIVHFKLVDIHPFLDGNGRTARALATLILYKGGYETKKLFSLEEYYDKDLEKYYYSIQFVRDNNYDLTSWLEYFIKGIALEFERIEKEIKKISVVEKLPKKEQLELNSRQINALNYVEKHGKITNRDYRQLNDVSNFTAFEDIVDMSDKKILKKKGKGRAVYYELA